MQYAFLVTCKANLSRIHEKRLKLSHPQGKIIDKSTILNFFHPVAYWPCPRTVYKQHEEQIWEG